MTPEECRAGRKLLGWSRERLAGLAGISAKTVQKFEENGRGGFYPRSIPALRRALEAEGAEFTNGEAPGVRLRRGG